jgi:uncharacterized protein YceH (UPF0502 family)
LPTFNWVATPRTNGCLSCLAQVSDKGFIDTWAVAMGDKGVLDVVFCSDCIHQMGRMVGMATPQETEAFALREYELTEEVEKLKDEVDAWRQRLEKLIDLKVEDLGLDEPEIILPQEP